MTKNEELSDPNSIWNKTRGDEQVFVLVARDDKMPETIHDWIERAGRRGIPQEKLRKAFECYLAAVQWQKSNPHLVKKPD